MQKKRERTDIILDMLSVIQEKGRVKPTHLMYKANLSHTQMKSYLEELAGKGLVAKETEKGRDYIAMTDEGYKFLAKLKEMKEFEEAFGLR